MEVAGKEEQGYVGKVFPTYPYPFENRTKY